MKYRNTSPQAEVTPSTLPPSKTTSPFTFLPHSISLTSLISAPPPEIFSPCVFFVLSWLQTSGDLMLQTSKKIPQTHNNLNHCSKHTFSDIFYPLAILLDYISVNPA